MKTIQEIVAGAEYDFLRENPRLGDNLMFLTFGGSYAYGTNTSDSDVDIRGCAFNSKSDLLGMSNFEQVMNDATDTTVYSFRKLINLISNCNPNTIELLGAKSEHYIFYSPVAQELIENKKMFLSKIAVKSFGGYANQQLQRLANAVARDALTDDKKEQHILGSLKRAMQSFNDRYAELGDGSLTVYIGENAYSEDGGDELLVDAILKGYPLRMFRSMLSEMGECIGNYDKAGHRNAKKSKAGLCKHAMHLLRLYLMCFDILEKEEINTYRENDLELLMSVRNGKYMNEDGTYQPEFFELVESFEKRMKYAAENTSLPEKPDMKRIEEFVISVNERVLSKG